jgi:hypothetical protein
VRNGASNDTADNRSPTAAVVTVTWWWRDPAGAMARLRQALQTYAATDPCRLRFNHTCWL